MGRGLLVLESPWDDELDSTFVRRAVPSWLRRYAGVQGCMPAYQWKAGLDSLASGVPKELVNILLLLYSIPRYGRASSYAVRQRQRLHHCGGMPGQRWLRFYYRGLRLWKPRDGQFLSPGDARSVCGRLRQGRSLGGVDAHGSHVSDVSNRWPMPQTSRRR